MKRPQDYIEGQKVRFSAPLGDQKVGVVVGHKPGRVLVDIGNKKPASVSTFVMALV